MNEVVVAGPAKNGAAAPICAGVSVLVNVNAALTPPIPIALPAPATHSIAKPSPGNPPVIVAVHPEGDPVTVGRALR